MYKVGDKVEYYYHTKQGFRYGHGFIKVINKNIFKTRYVIQLYKENDIHICEPRQIISRIDFKHKENEVSRKDF